jgi:menaquinone-specific isochorismate synthase
VLENDGLTLLGLGTAASIELPSGLEDPSALARVVARLGAIAEVSSGAATVASACPSVPIALGALPFDRKAAGRLAVPEMTVVARPGALATAVVVGSRERLPELVRGPLELVARREAEVPTPPPDEFTLRSSRSHQDFLARVDAALAEIATGPLEKIVLAREVQVIANRPLRQSDLLERLRALHPSCTVFGLDGFLGATPELLISRFGARIASCPLAGTAARSGDPEADSKAAEILLLSAKERREHRSVVDAITIALASVTASLEFPAGPTIRELRNVSHLATSITGTLAAREGGYPSALDLVGLLHPTPAVAGVPVELALSSLTRLEDLDRDRYAGPLGWVDARGDGEWHLGIRSAVVEGSSARLYAGVGVVAGSDPAAELAETQLKLQAFLAAAVRP